VGAGVVAGVAQVQVVGEQARQPDPLGEAQERDDPDVGDEVGLVEGGGDRRGRHERLHLRDALLIVRGEALDKPIIAGRKASLRFGAVYVDRQPVDPG
jgi:hypothetical protein